MKYNPSRTQDAYGRISDQAGREPRTDLLLMVGTIDGNPYGDCELIRISSGYAVNWPAGLVHSCGG